MERAPITFLGFHFSPEPGPVVPLRGTGHITDRQRHSSIARSPVEEWQSNDPVRGFTACCPLKDKRLKVSFVGSFHDDNAVDGMGAMWGNIIPWYSKLLHFMCIQTIHLPKLRGPLHLPLVCFLAQSSRRWKTTTKKWSWSDNCLG